MSAAGTSGICHFQMGRPDGDDSGNNTARRSNGRVLARTERLSGGYVRQITRVGNAIAIDEPLGGHPELGDGDWYYATVSYDGRQMGLLVGTDDQEEARLEAEGLCEAFGDGAKVITIQKIVLQ